MATWAVYINDREMTPYNLDNVKITTFREEYMRIHRKLSSPLYFINSPIDDNYDYDYIIGLSFDDKHTVTIAKNGVTKYTGEFNKAAIKVSRDDIGERMVSLTPDAIDEYTAIHDVEDIEVNVIDNESIIVRGQLKSYITFSFYYWERPVPSALLSGELYIPEHALADWDLIWEKDSPVINRYQKKYRLYASEKIIVNKDRSMSGWTKLDDYGKTILYGRVPVDYTSYFTDNDINGFFFSSEKIPPSNNYKFICPMRELELHEGLYWKVKDEIKNYVFIENDRYNLSQYLNSYVYYVAYDINKCIETILKQINPDFSGTYKSPTVLNNRLYLIDKGDFIRPFNLLSEQGGEHVNITTIANTTFKKLITDINILIKGTWYIDENGDFRIEQISGMVSEVGTDISSYITSKDDYEYINDEIPNRIIMSTTEAWSEDFTQKEIVYGNIPTLQGLNEQKQEISFSTFTTDFDGANQNLDKLSDTGFILIEVETLYTTSGNIYTVKKGTGKYSGDTQIQNANLSIANILYNYYRDEAYKQTFMMNGVETEALSLKKLKVQPSVVAILSQEPDIENLITTLEGEGEIDTIEESCTDENLYTMRILYPH